MSVLDLCCGDGYFTAPLAKLAGNVYALDLDPLMIELAKAEVARLHTSVLKWICADARDAPQHITESVDYVLMANTFHGVPDQSGLMETIRAMIRPNGLFGVVNWHALPRELTMVLNQPRGPKSDLRMSPEALQAVVEPSGFQTIRVQELPILINGHRPTLLRACLFGDQRHGDRRHALAYKFTPFHHFHHRFFSGCIGMFLGGCSIDFPGSEVRCIIVLQLSIIWLICCIMFIMPPCSIIPDPMFDPGD